MTFHTQIVGSNGQRQAMFIERMPGLAEVILVQLRRSARTTCSSSSRRAACRPCPVEMARGARRRGIRVIGVTSVAQSLSDPPDPSVGSRLMDEADLVIDLCTPHADALDLDRRPRHPGGPGLDDHRHRHRQLHQGAHRTPARRAGCDATGHHPGIGRRRRTLAEPVRRSLSRACTAHRRGHRWGEVMVTRAAGRR